MIKLPFLINVKRLPEIPRGLNELGLFESITFEVMGPLKSKHHIVITL